jgi:hypothetical protein
MIALGVLWSCDNFLQPYVNIDTDTIPDGTVGQPYSAAVHASVQNFVDDNRYDFVFSVSDGNVPAGLTLTANENVATISGTPTVAGSQTLQIQVYSPRLYTEISSNNSQNSEATSSNPANGNALNRATDAKTFKLTISPPAAP